MRIAHVIPSFYPAVGYGGPIEASYQLCRWLSRNGAEVRVLTTDANGRRERLETLSGRVVELTEGLEVRYCRRLMRHSVAPGLVRDVPSYVRWADVVHLTAVYSFPTIPTLIACRAQGKPLVWSPRGALQRWEGSRRTAAKSFWERLCLTIIPSQLVLHVTSEEEAYESTGRLHGVKTRVVPNGVTIPEQVRCVPDGKGLRLLYLGRLDTKKGLEVLLEACGIVRDRGEVKFHLTIAGSGEDRYIASLRRRIGDLGIAELISMPGWLDDTQKKKLFEEVDILVMPSRTENFGMVAAEALAHGVPVIASHGTPWRRLEEVGCGLWVSNDAESLATAIQNVSHMPHREMGERGREWMTREFAWAGVARRMVEVYRELLRAGP